MIASSVSRLSLREKTVALCEGQIAQQARYIRRAFLCLLVVLLGTGPLTTGAVAAAARQPRIQGTWQGVLHVPQGQLRAVVKVSGNNLNNLEVQVYSIDLSGQPTPASNASFHNGVFKYSIESTNSTSTFEGKMSADGQSISGTVKRGSFSTPIVLERATPKTAWTIPDAAKGDHSQP